MVLHLCTNIGVKYTTINKRLYYIRLIRFGIGQVTLTWSSQFILLLVLSLTSAIFGDPGSDSGDEELLDEWSSLRRLCD